MSERRALRAARRGPAVVCPVGQTRDWLFFDRESHELVCELHAPGNGD